MKKIQNNTFEIKGVKSYRGHEGYGFNATLYINGKKACFIMDDANGGCYDYEWEDCEAEKVDVRVRDYHDKENFKTYKGTPFESILAEAVITLPKVVHPDISYYPDMDSFIGSLVDDYEETKQFKRWCKKSTVFRLKGDKEGEWRTLKILYVNGGIKQANDYLDKKYGDKVEEILNKRFVK